MRQPFTYKVKNGILTPTGFQRILQMMRREIHPEPCWEKLR